MATPKRPKHVNLQLLPPQLRMLVRIMGEQPAFKLVEVRGGTPIVVPVKVSPDHWLMDIVGPQAFAALVNEMAGMTTDLPKADAIFRQWRHQRVHALVGGRMTDAEIALATGYTRRHVINIRQAEAEHAAAGGDGNPAQFDLFAAVDAELDATLGADAGPTAHDPFGLARPASAAET